MRKPKTGALLGVLDTGISVTGRWRCQRLTSTGVLKSQNEKLRNREIGTSLEVLDTRIWLPGDGDEKESHHKESQSHETRSQEMMKTPYRSFENQE
jgi:hypothetical protein